MTSIPQAIERLERLADVLPQLRHSKHWTRLEQLEHAADLRLLLTQYDAALEANRAMRRKLAEHGVTLIDNVDEHIAALTKEGKSA